MSSLWTPDGERPVQRETQDAAHEAGGPDVTGGASDPLREAAKAMGVDLDSLSEEERAQLQGELSEMMRVRREVAGTPAAEMLTNYLMRFFDLATIYLEGDPPAFNEAATVIEAFRCLLDGIGDRLGESEPLLREALGQLQMVFVQVKNAAGVETPEA